MCDNTVENKEGRLLFERDNENNYKENYSYSFEVTFYEEGCKCIGKLCNFLL